MFNFMTPCLYSPNDLFYNTVSSQVVVTEIFLKMDANLNRHTLILKKKDSILLEPFEKYKHWIVFITLFIPEIITYVDDYSTISSDKMKFKFLSQPITVSSKNPNPFHTYTSTKGGNHVQSYTSKFISSSLR